MYPAFRLTILFTLSVVLSVQCQAGAQDTAADDEKLVSIKGRLVQDASGPQIVLAKLEPLLEEFVGNRMPQAQTPKEWNDWSMSDRRKWIREFEASDEGKKLIAQRQAVLDKARRFPIQLEEDGSFVVYDVPPGTYFLRGQAEEQLGEKGYLFQIMGQISVQKQADEILLDPMLVEVIRQFQPGQQAPTFQLELLDGKGTIDSARFAGKAFLLNVWAAEASPPSLQMQKEIQQMLASQDRTDQLLVVSVCFDQQSERARKLIQDNSWPGFHATCEGWGSSFARDFGVRSLPYIMLVDAQGKILLTHKQVLEKMMDGQPLKQIVSQALAE